MTAEKLKNYTTRVPAAKTIGEMQAMLVKHGVEKIQIEYESVYELFEASRIAGMVGGGS